MVLYKCERCGYETSLRANYRMHLERKTLCSATYSDISFDEMREKLNCRKHNGYKCDYCDKTFRTSQLKFQHKRRCQYINSANDDRIAVFEKELQDLKHSMGSTIHSNNTTNTNCHNNTTNNIQNNVSINVTLRSFGSENMDALPEDLIGNQFIFFKFKDLLENLHCDPNYPENHNIRIKSVKRGVLEIYRGDDKWDLVSFVNGLNELLLQGHKIFDEYYQKNKEKILDEDMTEEDLEALLKQLEKIEQLNENDVKPLRKELQLMLEGHRNALRVKD